MPTPPYAFSISTARTGGGKYDPDDIRFQILNRLLRGVRDDRARVLGEEHPDTLATQAELEALLAG
ncbi:hypothetical protein ACFCX0_02030 [Streptomyces sp. NPDC056352]|uniref:hypothetical protein n=1 Tax=Streptomyces sp. NPDC056352 TaxID=3345791 RepID=UPI0035E32E25